MPFSWTDSSPDDFSVDVRVDLAADGPIMFVRIVGELDVATGPLLTTAVADQQVEGRPVHDVRVDLKGLEFIDASGLRALLAAIPAHPATLVDCPASARRLLDITDLTQRFRFV